MNRPALGLVAWLLGSLAFGAGSIEVNEPWAKIINAGQAEVYMTLRNPGAEQDRLVGASSPLASSIKLLATVQLGAVQSVQPLKSIGLPAGGQQVLLPGRTHLAVVLKRPLQPGEALPLTLQFEQAGQRDLQVNVR